MVNEMSDSVSGSAIGGWRRASAAVALSAVRSAA
jgi:hypothetical protein